MCTIILMYVSMYVYVTVLYEALAQLVSLFAPYKFVCGNHTILSISKTARGIPETCQG